MGRNVTKSYAIAHGLQLPICSIDQSEIWDTHLFDSGVVLVLT